MESSGTGGLLRALAWLFVPAAATFQPGHALAQEAQIEILILSFKGEGGKNVRNRLVKELSGEPGVDIVPRKDAITAGQKLGIPPDSLKPTHMAKLGEHMGFDATVMGEITSIEGGPSELELTVVLTMDPDHPQVFTYTWATGSAPQATVEKATSDILAAAGAASVPSEVITPFSGEQEEQEEEIEVEDEPAPAKPSTGPRGQIISVQAGMMLMTRKLSISTTPPPGIDYDGSAFSAIDAELAFFPARIATAHPYAGIGIGVSFTRSLALTSHVEGVTTASYGTALTALDILVLYEIPLGRAPLWLRLDAGWGLYHFRIDTGTSPPLLVSSFDYKNVIFGATLRIVAAGKWLEIDVGGDVRFLHGWGDAEPAYGASASGIGGTARLGLAGVFAKGFGWSAGFEYTGMRTSFSGPCTDPYACLTADASVAQDSFIGGWLRLGYSW